MDMGNAKPLEETSEDEKYMLRLKLRRQDWEHTYAIVKAETPNDILRIRKEIIADEAQLYIKGLENFINKLKDRRK